MSFQELTRAMRERILILDGAMGSMLAGYKLSDILCLEKPELITGIHEAYLEAGADIISTCSFNANAVSLASHGLSERAYEISRAAGELARAAADTFSTKGKKRFVAGSMGPSSKSASICQDINHPEKRAIRWDELEAAYYDNARGLLDGGVDILLLETIFDTLNAKAAIAAVMRLREERNAAIPLMISATIANDAGRLLSGQSLEDFVSSVAHAEPFSLGLNCSFGAEKMLPHLASLSAFSPFPLSCYPNAGLPDNSGAYHEGPEEMALSMKEFFERKLVNIAGGCCGTTPDHIAAISEAAKKYAPRPLPEQQKAGPAARVLEGKSVAGDPKLAGYIKDNNWEDAAELMNELIDEGADIIKVNLEAEFPGEKESITRFLNSVLFDPAIARTPMLFECPDIELLEVALKCVPGKSFVDANCLKKGTGDYSRSAALVRRCGAEVVKSLRDFT